MIPLFVMAKYFPSQVLFATPEERRDFQRFCRDHFGRSFSDQCRHMLLKAKREAAKKEKTAEPKAAS